MISISCFVLEQERPLNGSLNTDHMQGSGPNPQQIKRSWTRTNDFTSLNVLVIENAIIKQFYTVWTYLNKSIQSIFTLWSYKNPHLRLFRLCSNDFM